MIISVLLGVQVEPDDLGNLKDSMEHYLQDAAEPDFVEAGPLCTRATCCSALTPWDLLEKPWASCCACLRRVQVSFPRWDAML